MRGTLHIRLGRYYRNGIIPAYAGNTLMLTRCRQCSRDHPRVCGEHLATATFAERAPGSSPRMRGTPDYVFMHCRDIGIIPAYAGNTGLIRGPRHHRRDHPRVCGEHGTSVWCLRSCRGSSPRMRGTRKQQPAHRHRTGIIPAYAGNTPWRPRGASATRDHPRVCGEHEVEEPVTGILEGSSPRMRGTPSTATEGLCPNRIIPAYAGNT